MITYNRLPHTSKKRIKGGQIGINLHCPLKRDRKHTKHKITAENKKFLKKLGFKVLV